MASEASVAQLGDFVPEPLGFIALGPECLVCTEGTGTEDRAPQGCDPSAEPEAGSVSRLKTQYKPNAVTQNP